MTMAIRELSPALQKLAESELNEDPRRISSDIQAMKQWLKKQPHLHSVKSSDQWLLVFLRGCKFSLERSKEKLDTYYTLRTLVPEFFSDRDPMLTPIQDVLKLGAFLPLKSCASAAGPRVCLVRLGGLDASKYHLSDILKVSFMITEILMLEDDHFAVAGEEVILDLKDVGMSVIAQWTPSVAKKVTSCMEKSLPIRQRGNHILNTPKGFEAAYTLFQMFLSNKLKKRIKVHNQNYEALHENIPKSILPTEYGGEDGSVEELIEYWRTKVESHRDWFLNEAKQFSEETRRPGKPKSCSELFGVEGSFRKLEVD